MVRGSDSCSATGRWHSQHVALRLLWSRLIGVTLGIRIIGGTPASVFASFLKASRIANIPSALRGSSHADFDVERGSQYKGNEARSLEESPPIYKRRACPAELILYRFNSTVPYTYKEQERGERMFAFADQCVEMQQCLGIRDDMLWNAQVAAFGTAFPTFENDNLPKLSPSGGQAVIDNSCVLFDEESVMHIEGVGIFKGPIGIGSYLAVPHSQVSGLRNSSVMLQSFRVIGKNSVIGKLTQREVWTHIPNRTFDVEWRVELVYYPCSTK